MSDYHAFMVQSILMVSRLTADELLSDMDSPLRIQVAMALLILNSFTGALGEIEVALRSTSVVAREALLKDITDACERYNMRELNLFFLGRYFDQRHMCRHLRESQQDMDRCKGNHDPSQRPVTDKCNGLKVLKLNPKLLLETFWKSIGFLHNTHSFPFFGFLEISVDSWKTVLEDLSEYSSSFDPSVQKAYLESCVVLRLSRLPPMFCKNPFLQPEMEELVETFAEQSPFELSADPESYLRSSMLDKEAISHFQIYNTLKGIIHLESKEYGPALYRFARVVELLTVLMAVADGKMTDFQSENVLLLPENTTAVHVLLSECCVMRFPESGPKSFLERNTELRDVTNLPLTFNLFSPSKRHYVENMLAVRAVFSEKIALKLARKVEDGWLKMDTSHLYEAARDYILLASTKHHDDPALPQIYDRVVWCIMAHGNLHADAVLFFWFIRFYSELNQSCQVIPPEPFANFTGPPVNEYMEGALDGLARLKYYELAYDWPWWILCPCLVSSDYVDSVFDDCVRPSWYSRSKRLGGILKDRSKGATEREILRTSNDLVELWFENYKRWHGDKVPHKVEEYHEFYYTLGDILEASA